jgi:hypothetical protein
MSVVAGSVGSSLGPPWWRVPWDFAVHVLVGTLIFTTIGLGALAIDLLIQSLEVIQVSPTVILGLRLAEYALFIADLTTFLVFIWRTTVRAIKGL